MGLIGSVCAVYVCGVGRRSVWVGQGGSTRRWVVGVCTTQLNTNTPTYLAVQELGQELGELDERLGEDRVRVEVLPVEPRLLERRPGHELLEGEFLGRAELRVGAGEVGEAGEEAGEPEGPEEGEEEGACVGGCGLGCVRDWGFVGRGRKNEREADTLDAPMKPSQVLLGERRRKGRFTTRRPQVIPQT